MFSIRKKIEEVHECGIGLFNIIIFAIYFAFVSMSIVVVSINSFIAWVIFFPIVCIASYFISVLLINFCINFQKNISFDINSKKNNRLLFFIVDFLAIFLFGVIINVVKMHFGKKTFEGDFLDSILEAKNNLYSEQRSPLFSIIFAKIPLLFLKEEIIYIYYCFIRSFIISYIISDISKNKKSYVNFILLLFYLIMPLSLHSASTIMKDTPCALFCMLTIYLLYKSFYVKEKLLLYDVLIALFMTLAYYMRPNALVFTHTLALISLVIFIIIFKEPIRGIRICVFYLLFLFVINFCILKQFKIGYSNRDFKLVEVCGFHVANLISVAKHNPEALNENEKKFIEEYLEADSEALEAFDEKHGYGSIKYNNDSKAHGVITKRSYFDLLKMSIDLFIREHYYSIKQAVYNTCSLYQKRNIHTPNNIFVRIYYLLADFEIPILFFLSILVVYGLNSIKTNMEVINILIFLPMFLYCLATCFAMATNRLIRYYLPFQMTFPIYMYFNLLSQIKTIIHK